MEDQSLESDLVESENQGGSMKKIEGDERKSWWYPVGLQFNG